MTQATKVQKTVTVLFTYIFKHICRVCFVTLSSDGETRYHTCFDNGKASCTCPAGQKSHICYHVTQLRPRYNAIVASKQQEITPAAKLVAQYRKDGQMHTVVCINGQLVDTTTEAEVVAAVAEVQAERKMGAFKQAMDEQYASDPRTELAKQIEARETAASNLRAYYNGL